MVFFWGLNGICTQRNRCYAYRYQHFADKNLGGGDGGGNLGTDRIYWAW